MTLEVRLAQLADVPALNVLIARSARQLLASCEAAVHAAGYSSLELMATLPGVPFYSALGFKPVRDVTDVLPDGTPIEFVHMQRPVTPE